MVTVPSPQCVGREFVRQYYTLLNQEPVQIHRYNVDDTHNWSHIAKVVQ